VGLDFSTCFSGNRITPFLSTLQKIIELYLSPATVFGTGKMPAPAVAGDPENSLFIRAAAYVQLAFKGRGINALSPD
jgi:hypothetical protein